MTAAPSASVEIAAPIDVVWSVMLEASSYAEWNPFVEGVEVPDPPSVGDPIVLHVRWTNGSTSRSPERITEVTPPADGAACLAYAYQGVPSKLGLVRSVRYQRLTALDAGHTRYDTVGEFTGPLARFAGPGRIADGFRRHAEGLKARAESLAARG